MRFVLNLALVVCSMPATIFFFIGILVLLALSIGMPGLVGVIILLLPLGYAIYSTWAMALYEINFRDESGDTCREGKILTKPKNRHWAASALGAVLASFFIRPEVINGTSFLNKSLFLLTIGGPIMFFLLLAIQRLSEEKFKIFKASQ